MACADIRRLYLFYALVIVLPRVLGVICVDVDNVQTKRLPSCARISRRECQQLCSVSARFDADRSLKQT